MEIEESVDDDDDDSSSDDDDNNTTCFDPISSYRVHKSTESSSHHGRSIGRTASITDEATRGSP